MPSRKRTATLRIVLALPALLVPGVAATPGVAGPELLAAAPQDPQDPSAVEASFALERSTRRLIQQGLSTEGFDPTSIGYPTGAEELLRPAALPTPAVREASPPSEAPSLTDLVQAQFCSQGPGLQQG